jgi:hypothetical protein
MPRMNGTGPEQRGSGTGRGLGNCPNNSEIKSVEKLGKGLGVRRRSGGGQGKGRRLKSGLKDNL